jgi:outer membrane protein TolC
MMKKKILFALAFVLSLIFLAGEVYSEPAEFTLAQIIDLYKQNNIDLQIQRIEVDNADSRKKIVQTWENPVIQYLQEGINIGDSADHLRARELQFVLGKKISFSGVRTLQIKQAASGIEIASDDYALTFWDGLFSVKMLYSEIQYLMKHLDILLSTKEKVDGLKNIIVANYEQGEASAIDLSRIEIVLKDLALENNDVEKLIEQKRRELMTHLDIPQESEPLTLTESWGQLILKELKETVFFTAIENNPQLQRLADTYTSNELQLSLERRKVIPDIMATGGYKKEDNFDTYTFSLSLDFPILNQRKGEIEIAKNILIQNKFQQRKVKNELLKTLETEYIKYLKSTELIRLFQSTYLPSSDKLENASIAAYTGGEIAILTLVDALQSAYRTRIEFIDLILKSNSAVFSIEKITGEELNVEER